MATSGVGADFRDAEGFPIVGGRCSLATCNAQDFLPFVCRLCGAYFCQDHREPSAHDCTKASDAIGVLAVSCPHCHETVRWNTAESTQAQALEEHALECMGIPKAKSMCPAAGCHVELGLITSIICQLCQQRVCMVHRFEDSHPCRQKVIESQNLELPRAVSPLNAPIAVEDTSKAMPMGTLTNPPVVVEACPKAMPIAPPLASMQQLRELRNRLEGTTAAKSACLSAMRRLLSDISRHPGDFAFRSLQRDRGELCEKILVVHGAEDLLKGVGFQDDGKTLQLPVNISKGRIDVALRILA